MLRDNGFSLDEMELFHYGKPYAELYEILDKRYTPMYSFINIPRHLQMLHHLIKSERIIVHSLASPILLLYIWLFPSVASKVIWVIWGKDLYFFRTMEHPMLHHYAYEWLRKKAIAKIKHTVSILKEDFNFLQSWYQCNAANIECNLLYPYALSTAIGEYHNPSKQFTILLGNSASKTNRHIDALNLLYQKEEQISKIYCPLSYGSNKSYTQKVVIHGKSLFGNRFIALTDFMPKEHYFRLLESIDIGFFNYLRQEGLGNIWSLLFAKKTIYINSNTSTWNFFKRIGIDVHSIDCLKTKCLETVSETTANKNIEILTKYISEDKSVETWRKILYEKL